MRSKSCAESVSGRGDGWRQRRGYKTTKKRARQQQEKMDAQNDLSTWIAGIPKVTKWWFFSFFIVPVTTRLGLISPMTLLLFSESVFYRFEVGDELAGHQFKCVCIGRACDSVCIPTVEVEALFFVQIWRLVTCLLWYKVNFHWLMLLYFLYSYSQRLETGW